MFCVACSVDIFHSMKFWKWPGLFIPGGIFPVSGLVWRIIALFLPVTYSQPVCGLKDDEPRFGPPTAPGAIRSASLLDGGVKITRDFSASFGSSMFGGNVAQNGDCGTNRAVKGIGWVGETSSPGTSLLVGTAI